MVRRDGAAPITPTRDDEVVEVLPAAPAAAARTGDCASDSRRSPTMRHLRCLWRGATSSAHELGDPRYAGLALAALRAWPDAATAPGEMLLMRATLQQYLHEFDAAAATSTAARAARRRSHSRRLG